MKINTILFDFDGTVANTNGLIIDSWQYVYQALTGRRASEEVIKSTFGEPLAISMEKAFPDTPPQQSIDLYREHQKDIYEDMIEPFPGMTELIRELKERNYKIGIVTSRLRNTTMIGLRKFGLLRYIDDIVTCEDTDRHKPDPAPVLIALERLSADPQEALMVGDSRFDIGCAHNAKVKAVLVGWAEAMNGEEAEEEKPEYIIEKAEDLLRII